MNKYIYNQNYFEKLPGHIIAYWMSKEFFIFFVSNKIIQEQFDLNCGIKTGNNNIFLRFWFEVNSKDMCENPKIEINSKKWFFYNKGGGYRKWYGGYENVINFKNYGEEIKKTISSSTYRLRDECNYFKDAIIWPLVGDIHFSARILPCLVLPDVACNAIFNIQYQLLSYMNSIVFNESIKFINSTVSYPIDSVGKVPFKYKKNIIIDKLAIENIEFCKQDWDSFEISWDFKKHPLI